MSFLTTAMYGGSAWYAEHAGRPGVFALIGVLLFAVLVQCWRDSA